ncbi:hypothetical protein SOVF_022950 [Spinacia oleracea]|nr:hypothetical protein SOVF_022950 [Spinacia oleracea]
MEEKWGWPAIGIDLGARFSSVAVWQHGQVEILMNDQGNRKTPSYVAFTGNQCLVGDAAKNQSDRNPANTIFGAAVEESFLVPGKRLRKAVQSRVQEPSPSLILQDVDSLLKELSFNLSNDVKYVSSSATQFLNLLKKIRRKPDDPKLTRQVSQSLKNFYPSIDKHWLTIIKSIEENLLVSQHQYLEWASKEAAIPLKQEEAGTTHNQLVSIKNKMVQKSLSQDQLRSKITVIDEELAKLLDRKSQLEVDLNFVEEDLCKLTRSVGAQLDLARKQSVQLACLREASNFKAKAKISMDASLDSLAKYFRNL